MTFSAFLLTFQTCDSTIWNNSTFIYLFPLTTLSPLPLLHILVPPVTIDSLYKVTEGGQSDIFHRHADGSFDPACCFTVYHGNHMESLDLVTSNAEEARTWITGLRYLMAGISDEDSLAKRQRTHDQYPFKRWSVKFRVLTFVSAEARVSSTQ